MKRRWERATPQHKETQTAEVHCDETRNDGMIVSLILGVQKVKSKGWKKQGHRKQTNKLLFESGGVWVEDFKEERKEKWIKEWERGEEMEQKEQPHPGRGV